MTLSQIISLLTFKVDRLKQHYILLSTLLLKNRDQGHINAICTLDKAKGFDTISHNILLHKLSFYGFDSNSINFFISYLNNRCQKVKCGSLISKENSVEIGIPQGSILGPILFIIVAVYQP